VQIRTAITNIILKLMLAEPAYIFYFPPPARISPSQRFLIITLFPFRPYFSAANYFGSLDRYLIFRQCARDMASQPFPREPKAAAP
jgi:hypothetical protein